MISFMLFLIILGLFLLCVEWVVQRAVKNAINDLLAQNVIQFTGKLPPQKPVPPPYPEELRKMEAENQKED